MHSIFSFTIATLILTACSQTPISATPTLLPSTTPTHISTATPTLLPTLTSIPPVHELTAADLEKGRFGNHEFVKNSAGYYEMKDAQGNIIPEVRFFEDGVAEWQAMINGEKVTLTVAFQAIKIGSDGQMIFGLWDVEGNTLNPVHTMSAAEMVASHESSEKSPYGLNILIGHEKAAEMVETMFLARDLSMTPEEMRAEYDGIVVEYNFTEYNTTTDFDEIVVPRSYRVANYARESKANGGPNKTAGLYKIIAEPKSSTMSYSGKLYSIAPQQIALGSGWFESDVYSLSEEGKWEFQEEVVHITNVLVNPDGSFMLVTSMGTPDLIFERYADSLTKESRIGDPLLFMTDKAIAQVHYGDVLFSDPRTRNFVVELNQAAMENFTLPELDDALKYNTKLPDELREVIFFD